MRECNDVRGGGVGKEGVQGWSFSLSSKIMVEMLLQDICRLEEEAVFSRFLWLIEFSKGMNFDSVGKET